MRFVFTRLELRSGGLAIKVAVDSFAALLSEAWERVASLERIRPSLVNGGSRKLNKLEGSSGFPGWEFEEVTFCVGRFPGTGGCRQLDR